MIVTVSYRGKPFGSAMNDLREDDLLWFIKDQLELGREIHIAPEMIEEIWPPKETPPSQVAPERRMEHCCNCFWYENDKCLLPGPEYLKPKQPNDTCVLERKLSYGTKE